MPVNNRTHHHQAPEFHSPVTTDSVLVLRHGSKIGVCVGGVSGHGVSLFGSCASLSDGKKATPLSTPLAIFQRDSLRRKGPLK